MASRSANIRAFLFADSADEEDEISYKMEGNSTGCKPASQLTVRLIVAECCGVPDAEVALTVTV